MKFPIVSVAALASVLVGCSDQVSQNDTSAAMKINEAQVCRHAAIVSSKDPASSVPETCDVRVDGKSVRISSGTAEADGEPVVATYVRGGENVTLDGNFQGTPNDGGYWTNFGAVFIVEAQDEDLCLAVNNFSPDGTTDSLFLVSGDDTERSVFTLSVDAAAITKTTYPEVVAPANAQTVLTILPREPNTGISAVAFEPCA